MAKKKYMWIIGMVIIVGALFFIFFGPNVKGYEFVNDFEGDIKIYKSSSCGCCSIYGDYFKRQGNSNTNVISMNYVDSIKIEYNIPLELRSCHTTIIGDYFVEGHIPLEAVNKLMEERPDIAGIAMPGMPSGSPGMPGTKTEDFVIYAIDHDGGYEEFMRM